VILNAARLTSFQRCPRILKHAEANAPRRWRPRELAEIHLRKGVLALSQGAAVAKVTADLQASFLEVCANPGLDVECQPFTLARDWTAILGNVLEAVSRGTLPKLKAGPNIILSTSVSWECKSFQDEAGLLHRWVMVDKLDDDSLTRELHSWHVDGDRCAAQVPMTLHVVEVGRLSGNHQSSPWCRIYKHPQVIGRMAFQQQNGSPLEGNWKVGWFQDGDKNKASTWVDLMERDKVKLIHEIKVKGPTVEQVAEFTRQVAIEAQRMVESDATHWKDLPMFRPACDLPPCPYRPRCFSR
jgi:hypothetical protein